MPRLRFTRRTFAWLSTSLLKGMSREGERVIFFAVVIWIAPRRAAESLFLDLQPVTKRSVALFLSRVAPQNR